jgi:hypothetical protein
MGQNRFRLLDARHSGNEALSKATPGLRIAMASNGGSAGWIMARWVEPQATLSQRVAVIARQS